MHRLVKKTSGVPEDRPTVTLSYVRFLDFWRNPIVVGLSTVGLIMGGAMLEAKAIRKHSVQHDLFHRLHSIAADEAFVRNVAEKWYETRFEVVGECCGLCIRI